MSWLLFAALFFVSLSFQSHSGAWQSDFGGHADEGAHVVTSLMVRDYLAGGFLETPHPMRYAQGYYARFPKVALGHYPPGFYLAASVILLPFRSGAGFLLLMNALAAGAALLVGGFAGRMGLGRIASVAMAFAYLLLPQTRTYTAIIMADLLLVLLALLAARSFARFVRSGTARDSLLFGLWAALAILTKGSAIGLALLPPLALVIGGRADLLRSPRLWLAPIPVLLLALPWICLTVGITAEGMEEEGRLAWVGKAVPFYGRAILDEAGWAGGALLVLAVLGGIIKATRNRRGLDAEESVLWALLIGAGLVPFLVPAGLDSRYLMPLLPPLLLLGANALHTLVPDLSGAGALRLRPFVAVIPALVILAETSRPVRKYYTGASAAVARIREEADRGEGPHRTGPVRILAVSDATGEGALVAAAALQDPGRFRCERGSKFLAKSDWLGRDYAAAFRTPEELRRKLRDGAVDFLVLEPPTPRAPWHWQALDGWLRDGTLPAVTMVAGIPSWRREVESRFLVYRMAAD